MTTPEPLTAPRTNADQLRDWLSWAQARMAGIPAPSLVDRIITEAFEAGAAAEQAKVARLVERFAAMKMAAVFPDGRPDRTGYAAGWNDALDEVLPGLRTDSPEALR